MRIQATMTDSRFDERYLAEAFAALETSEPHDPTGRKAVQCNLEEHAQSLTRAKYLHECETAVAELVPSLREYLANVFEQITDSLLPAPIWQTPLTPNKKGKQKDADIVLQSLKIVSAARLALASHATARDRELKAKIDSIYRAAATYLDSTPQLSQLQDVEALLLLSELEYGRGQDGAARTRLQSVVNTLTDSMRMRSTLIFGQSLTLIRRRNALRTALMMLHWYFHEVPTPLEDLNVQSDLEPDENITNADELFVTSQLRLASLHHRLKRFLDAQPFVDEKTWSVCEKAFSMWYEEQKQRSKELDCSSDDAPVNFFVFHQQYLSTRIMLSKSHERLYRRTANTNPSLSSSETWTCPASARTDAIKIASSLRNYGQRHRFREAPLSFVNHIRAAADIVINAAEVANNEDDRNAFLHISSFLCGVLKYMAEVHIRANNLLDAVQQRMNVAIQAGLARSSSSAANWDVSSTYSAEDSHLWHWTRFDLTEELGQAPSSAEPDRPRSAAGIPQMSGSVPPKRPPIARQISTPAKLASHPEASESLEGLQIPTPSFYSIRDNDSVVTDG